MSRQRPKHGDAAPAGATYKAAGVDIDAGNAFVEALRPLAAATARPGVASELGGFGALFDLKAAGFKDPLLVAGADGVGTKLLVAEACGHHAGIGVDLVAMCVNDIAAQGAEPLFFLDYLATGRLDVEAALGVVAGIADGCREAGCALIGGETAEMPGLYEPGRYDLAGFAVGAVERDRVLPSAADPARAGDVILGLASAGLHANGFSLVRRVVADAGLDYATPAPFDPDRTLGRALLEPTRIYVNACRAAVGAGGVRGFAHVTGGGLVENVPRALPADAQARIDARAWPMPPVFQWLMETGDIGADEMARTFNCGIGMAVVVAAGAAEAVARALSGHGETAVPVGTVGERARGAPRAVVDNKAAWGG